MTASTDSPGVRFPPPLLYIGAFLIGIAANKWLPHPDHLPAVIHVIGWLLIVAWGVLAAGAFYIMRRARTTIRPDRGAAALVTDGVFRLTRNPLYLGLTLLYAGVACVLDVPWALVFLPVVVWIIHTVVIRSEEAYLTRAFGDAYTTYCERVRRWV